MEVIILTKKHQKVSSVHLYCYLAALKIEKKGKNTNIAANQGDIFTRFTCPFHKTLVPQLVIKYILVDQIHTHKHGITKVLASTLDIKQKSENNYFRNQLALHDLKSRRGEDSNPSSDEDVVGEPMILHTSLLCS